MKYIIPLIVVALITGAGLLGTSVAGHHYHGCNMSLSDVSKLDNDQDGVLSFDEFSAEKMEWLRSAFKMIDTNNDEEIDSEEWNTMLKIHGIGKNES